ncbi:MAG: hypothetical protein E7532_01135 [Ruminococcaceae bacterium]|nr:hypothetical protein [Oscillospiraceae bacterium]
MFCNNCGAQLNDDAKFCFCCGCQVSRPNEVVAEPASQPEPIIEPDVQPEPIAQPEPVAQDANPYAQYPAQETPVAEPYTQQAPPAYTPPAPQYTQPAPQYTQPTPPPAYMPPAPEQNYQPPVYDAYPQNPVYNAYPAPTPQEPAKHNAFTIISAIGMAIMFFIYLMPWVTTRSGENLNLFMAFSDTDLFYYADLEGLVFCAILMLVCIGMLIPGVVLAFVKRSDMPLGFAITASILSLVTVTFFAMMMTDAYRAYATPAPVFLFLFAIANIVFVNLAKRK